MASSCEWMLELGMGGLANGQKLLSATGKLWRAMIVEEEQLINTDLLIIITCNVSAFLSKISN